MYKFKVILNSDQGKIIISTSAESISALIAMITECEGCPEKAIIRIIRGSKIF
jgi:hypothetical protein